jgi:hypothetical protein
MLSKKQLRDAHIAIAVGAAIIFGGGFLVRNAGEAAAQLIVLAAFIAMAGTLVFFAEKEIKRQERQEREKRDQ